MKGLSSFISVAELTRKAKEKLKTSLSIPSIIFYTTVKMGKSIADKRKKAGFSQNAFALKCDMDRQNMHKIERGMVNISITTLKRIAYALNIPARNILDFE